MAANSPKTVFIPARADELQIDLDRPRARIPKRLLRLVSEHIQIRSISYSRSKSGNTHVTIKIAPIDLIKGFSNDEDCFLNVQRLFLQAVLGSDPVRELLSWGRARNGCPHPTLFFERKK